MKKIFIFIFFNFFIFVEIQADMPVIDFTAAINMGHQLDEMKTQYDEMVKQTKQMRQEYDSLNGMRGFGKKFEDKTFRDNLPDQWGSAYEDVRSKGYKGLTPEAKEIHEKNLIFDKCQSITVDDEKQACEADSAKAALDQAFVLIMLGKSEERAANIKNLLKEIDKTKDPKSIAELQARIAVEQNAISTDQEKLAMFKMASEAISNMQKQQQEEINARTWASREID